MTTSAVSVEEILSLAIRHANAGQRGRAKLLCEQADAAHPMHPAVKQLLAVLNLGEGNAVQARRYAESSLALRPDHVPTLVVAGDAARSVKSINDALRLYTRAHKLQPERPGICLTLGTLQRQCGQLQAASQMLEQAAGLAPDHADTWFELALVRQDLRDLDGAARALQRVLQLMPNRADAQVNMGIVLQDSGHIDEAMRAYGRAYRLHQDSFGRIAHALGAASVGRIWLDLNGLRVALQSSHD